jgi:hypothetical protein
MAFPRTWLCVCVRELILLKGERMRVPTKINDTAESDSIREAWVTRDFTRQSDSGADLRVTLAQAEIRSRMQA